jgi:hypothetical protein
MKHFREHFIAGIGYLEFHNGKRGWMLRRTADGKIGASYPAEFLGTTDEIQIRRPDLADAFARAGVKSFK